jgi:hypothetical protein
VQQGVAHAQPRAILRDPATLRSIVSAGSRARSGVMTFGSFNKRDRRCKPNPGKHIEAAPRRCPIVRDSSKAGSSTRARDGIVNLAARDMLVVSVARRFGSEGPLLAYCAALL